MELSAVFPPQPSTERARRTPLSYDAKNGRIAYASNKLVVVRSVEHPEEAQLLYGEHLQPVTTVAFASSGFYVASGDASGSVRVWGSPIKQEDDEFVTKGPYSATSGRLNGIAWCHESSRVLAVGDGKERYGHGFTADSGNTIAEISGHSAELNGVAVRPNRPMRSVTVGEDGVTVFYEGPPFRFARSTTKHVNAISDVAYAPDGAHFVTGGCDRKLAVYDGLSGEFKNYVETKHDGMILSVAFASPSLVLSASADCSVRLSNIDGELVETWQLPKTLANQQTGVIAAGETYISVGLNGDLCYWQRGQENPVRVVQGHQKHITALSPKGTITGSLDGTVVEWKKEGSRIDAAQHEGPVSGLVGEPVLSAGWDKRVIDMSGHEVASALHQPLAVSKSGDSIVAVSESSLDVLGGESVALEGRGTAVHAVGKLVAVGSGRTALLYSLPDLKLVHKFDPRQAEVSVVSISPDGKLVAVGDASGKILLYNSSDYSIVTSRWTFHSSRVTSIRWTKDSKRVVTGALDTNIFIYSVERPARNIKRLSAHKEGVTGVAWDGSEIVSAGIDAVVKRWKVVKPST